MADELLDTSSMPFKLTKRQMRFIENYYNPKSDTFGELYKSAINAGFGKVYSLRIMYDNPQWIQEAKKRLKYYSPDHIYQSLQEVAHTGENRDKLKALELMGKAQGMFIDRQQKDVHVTFTNDIPRPKSEIIDLEAEDAS